MEDHYPAELKSVLSLADWGLVRSSSGQMPLINLALPTVVFLACVLQFRALKNAMHPPLRSLANLQDQHVAMAVHSPSVTVTREMLATLEQPHPDSVVLVPEPVWSYCCRQT